MIIYYINVVTKPLKSPTISFFEEIFHNYVFVLFYSISEMFMYNILIIGVSTLK